MAENTNSFPAKRYCSDESKCDVIFLVDGQRIPAIKILLSLKSDVFEAMFSGNFKESEDKEIVINDVDPLIFGIMIRFLHCEELDDKEDIDYEMAIEIFKCAHKYQLDRLMNVMAVLLINFKKELFRKGINLYLLKELYELAVEYKSEKLKEGLNQLLEELVHFINDEDMEYKQKINTLSDNKLFEVMSDKLSELKNKLKNSESEQTGRNHYPYRGRGGRFY